MIEQMNYFIMPGLHEAFPDGKPARETILKIIASEKKVNLEHILTKTRNSDIVEARFIYIKLVKQVYNMTKVSIGRELGKDHTTIIHALKQFENRFKYEESFRHTTNKICVRLGIKLNN